MLLTMFIAIITDSYTMVKHEMKNQENQYEMMDFLSKKLRVLTGFASSVDDPTFWQKKVSSKDQYRDQIEALPRKVDDCFGLHIVFVERRPDYILETEYPLKNRDDEDVDEDDEEVDDDNDKENEESEDDEELTRSENNHYEGEDEDDDYTADEDELSDDYDEDRDENNFETDDDSDEQD
ncbi:hypothetical protein SNEBB_011377 [Seison nebaliae]|nr:hypothetical protein SNEBB_011377 [Seison nebaliae]